MVNFDGLPIPPEKEHLRKELEKVDESWSVARFDSLPHVVHILTSKDRESEVKILKEQSNVIEDVVDEVVHAYHGGFNKAIQNYSQILRLFGESTQSVDVLKGDLAEAKRSLGARNKQLHQLWYRSVTLRHIIALLDQIEGIAKVPARIEKLIADKQFYAAVQVHAHSTLMLEREGLQTVGALQDVRSELTKLRGILFYKVLEDLHAHLYNKGEYSSSAMSSIDESNDPLPTTMAITISMSSSQSLSRRTRSVKGDNHVGSYGHGNGMHQPGSIDGGSSFDGHDEDDALVDHDGTTTNGKGLKVASRQIPNWLSESTPDEFIEAMRKNVAPLHVKYLQTMVECLCMLGKVAAAGAMICQRLRPTIHEIITIKIKSHAERLNGLRPEIGQGAQTRTTSLLSLKGHRRHEHQNGISSARTQLAVSPVSPVMAPAGAAQAAANELLDSILDIVVRIFENHVTVGELLESKAAQQVNLNTPKAMMGGDSSWKHDSDTSHDTGGYSIGFSLTVLQSECQQLICEVLRATPEAASADASVQTARLANKTPAKQSKDKRHGGDDGVNFVFRLMDATISVPDQDLGADAVRQGRNRKGPNVIQEGYGTATVLPEQGIYLAASVYRPVLQFTDKVASMLPQNYPRHGNDVLLSFVENFVKDHFLPTMFVDYRKGVQQAISSPAAFRPRAHAAAAYSSSIEKGRPVLQGLLAIDFLAKEVLGWSQAMPKFAVELVTYVQTFLERAYERCRTSYMEAVLEKQSYMVIGRHDIEKLMRLDAASASLPQSHDQIDHEYSISDAETMETEMEISDLLLNLRPIKQENLIRDDNKLILLASLSDSLEYVADSIERLGKTCAKVSIADLHDRTNSAPPKDLATFAEEYRKLAIDCLKVLRIEMQLETIFHMQEIANREYLEDQDAEEPDDYIISLTSQITRRDEEMSPFIAGSKRKYIFGGICSVAANAFFKALSDMESINLFGVQQICRNSIALEQALAAIPFVDSEAIQLRLDRVRTYYELLNMPFEALLAFVTEHAHLFSAAEYTSLLNIQVPGRDIPQNARDRVAEILSY